MVPTVFGVILITFLLFNVAGGSPATMTLGKHISPKDLENFDEIRGFNKPLFLGYWTKTRAFEDKVFAEHAVTSKTEEVTLLFPLRADTDFRWTITYRLEGDASFAGMPLEPTSNAWRKASVLFNSGGDPGSLKSEFVLNSGTLEIKSIELRRKVKTFYDSQLLFYLKQIAHLDFGVSSSTNQRVSDMLLQGAGPSICLTAPIFFGELLVAVCISLFCAFYRNTILDRTIVVISIAMMSVNYLVWIVGGQYLLAYKAGWFPVWGFASLRFLMLPVIIGIVSGLGSGVRFYRTIMLDEMYKEYVRTAFAKGVSKRGVLFKHVLKNAMIPIITNVVIAIPFLYTGSLLLVSFYGIPGLGYISINAVNSSDVDVIRAVVLIGSSVFVVANLISDLCYAWVDPRVRLG